MGICPQVIISTINRVIPLIIHGVVLQDLAISGTSFTTDEAEVHTEGGAVGSEGEEEDGSLGSEVSRTGRTMAEHCLWSDYNHAMLFQIRTYNNKGLCGRCALDNSQL